MKSRKYDIYFWIITIVTLVFGLLLFNLRIDEGGDDSTYICRAMDVVSSGTYPTFQGPLYPWFLAIFVALFGPNLLVLKLTSLVCILCGHIVFYKLARKKLNNELLLAALGLLSINSLYLFFASQTYSESLYLLVQSIFLGLLLRLEDNATDKITVKQVLSLIVPIAICILCGYLIRTVGVFWLLVAVVYLCIRKYYKNAVILVGATILSLGVWTGVKTMIWGESKGQSQLTQLTQVHPYEVEKGQETIGGYFVRFAENSEKYLSKHMLRIAGFKAVNSRETSAIGTILIYVVFLYGAFIAYRKGNKVVILCAVLSATMMGVTFFALQTLWDQYRLIIPYVLAAYIVLIYGLYQLFLLLGKKIASIGIGTIVCLSAILSFAQTIQKIDLMQLKTNLSGNMLYGYTPDWYNYLGMCQAVAEHLPEDSFVACRKPNMARIYAGGKKFHGIYNFQTEDPDELLNALKERGVTHIILASLRRDPLYPGQGVINTIHRYMHFIVQKYPTAFYEIASMGNENQEPTYLYEINYDAPAVETTDEGKN
ncbi:MAG: glycosyltransferase family 39 protein [Bacteroidia bacterium]|nr:glycosyltransferase family 39 protein [Bacteroidia bacterium]